MSIYKTQVTLELNKQQLRQFARFCLEKGLECQSLFHELSGVDDKEDESDSYYAESEEWYRLEETFRDKLPKRIDKND